MALPSTSELLNAAHSAYYDGTDLPSSLSLFKVDNKPLMMRNEKTGFYGVVFVTRENKIIIAFEGTDISGFDDDPAFVTEQVLADYQIYLGKQPKAYKDALNFAKKAIKEAKAQNYSIDDIFLSGHSLGGAEAQYVATQLNLAGETYGGPGLPSSIIPANQPSQLVNYVEWGDPVGNYSYDADYNPLSNFLSSNNIERYGSASYLGDPLDALQLSAGNLFFGPNTNTSDNLIGDAILLDAAFDHHLLKYYAKDLNVNIDLKSTGIDAITLAEATRVLDTILKEDTRVYGGRGDDRLQGTAKNEVLRAGAGDDVLYGRGGTDRMFGNAGDDDLIGGTGRDVMTGGSGADTFMFRARAESMVSGSGRDTITDFKESQHDRIDLHLIDANTNKGGNQTFRFIGDDAFGHRAGELQAKYSGAHTLVRADTNGDGKADFAILVHGHVSFDKGDFIL